MIVLTVLKSGGDFKPEHVVRLHDQWSKWGPVDSSFMCLSDMELPSHICAEKLMMGWPGWWSKIEAFTIPGPVLYMDLDTTIVGDLQPFCEAAENEPFVALRDFNPTARDMGSGLMAWQGDVSHVFRAFAADPERHMRECRTSKKWGDQGFIQGLVPGKAYWQNLLPGKVVSWKKHCTKSIPESASIICFHGKPRPWQVDH